MPTINNLMTPNQPAAPATVPNQPATPNPAAVEPAAPPAALSPAAQQAMTASPFASTPKIVERPAGAYVGSAHPQSNNWPTCQANGVEEGDFYLDGAANLSGSPMVKLDPFKYWLYTVTAFCTEMDSSGNVLRASDRPDLIESQALRDRERLQLHFVTVVLVDLGAKIVPAKADFRHTKSGAVSTPYGEFQRMNDPNWPRLSDAHRVAAQFPHPFGRIYCTAWPVPGTVRGGPNKGKRYHAARGTAVPTALADMERLGKAFGDQEFTQALNQAMQTYAARVDLIRAAVK